MDIFLIIFFPIPFTFIWAGVAVQGPHLSKWPSDLKINGTKETLPFPGLVFHGRPCGVLLFAVDFCLKLHQ